MGNNPVGKKVNTPNINTWVNTFLLLALGFYQNPTGESNCLRFRSEVTNQIIRWWHNAAIINSS